MPQTLNIEHLIQEHAHRISEEMPLIAANAQSEEDIRHEFNKLIDEFLQSAGIQVRGRHEYGLAGGRIDSKYGGVILEFKYPKGPGRITDDLNAPGVKSLIAQIKQRFSDFDAEENIEANRLFAAGCDGRRFVFVRRRSGAFEIDAPQAVTPHSVERLLRALISLGAQGLSFTPEHLAAHFGADSISAQKGIRDIYSVVTQTQSIKAKTFFQQWKVLFGEVCGYDVEGRNDKIGKLGTHYDIRSPQPAELLFSLHTYYAVFMKVLAAEIAGSFSPLGLSVIKRCANAATPNALRREIEKVERGGIWSELGMTNFLEGDLFSWYLAAWDDKIADAIWGIVRQLDNYDPTTLSVDPGESHDLLKKLYQHLFPKSVRHDLGEYYTPDWLAELVLNEVNYDGNPDKRLLDPACGSGTFLVAAINRVKEWFEENRTSCGFGEKELLDKVLSNIIGFDLNPLAVMAARTNYLLAVRDLLKFSGQVELPVYLCDSIVTPSNPSVNGYRFKYRQLKTAAGAFNIPLDVVSGEKIGKYAEALESCVRHKYSTAEFLSRCRDESLQIEDDTLHKKLYEQLVKLDSENKNGIWARIIKNAFAPVFLGKVDYLVGNPPWINWESLPDDYRDDIKPLWEKYGLFSLSGTAGRLGGGKKDLSMLFVYGGADNYLAAGGVIGFVITQTIFKTMGAGDGFRRFQFLTDGKTTHLGNMSVHDLSAIQLFEGATNRTAILTCSEAPSPLDYPVPYVSWSGPSRIDQDESLADVLKKTARAPLRAVPVDPNNSTSPWLTVPDAALPGIGKIIGRSFYTGREGVNTGGLNGCYWIRVLKRLDDGRLVIENLCDVGKIKVEHVEAVIEPDRVYPLLRGRDVSRWRAEPSAHIILAQDPARGKGMPETDMKRFHPRTYEYLQRFEGSKSKPKRGTLRGRSLFKNYFKPSDPFYSMYGVSVHTLASWKVMWPEVGHSVRAGVRGPLEDSEKPALPDHTLVAIACRNDKEAHFICAVLNSSPAHLAVSGYVVLHPSPHVLEHLKTPGFSKGNKLHLRLAELSEKAHSAAVSRPADLESIEDEIDTAAAQLWGITKEELRAIQQAARNYKGTTSPVGD